MIGCYRASRAAEEQSWRATMAQETSAHRVQSYEAQEQIRDKCEQQIAALRADMEASLCRSQQREEELERALEGAVLCCDD